jgi:hypothetical protein
MPKDLKTRPARDIINPPLHRIGAGFLYCKLLPGIVGEPAPTKPDIMQAGINQI